MVKQKLILIILSILLSASSFANECTCELEDVITENSDAINIAISKYRDVVCERHKFDKSKCEVFVTPTFYPKYTRRISSNTPPYLQDVYALKYYIHNKSDSTLYEFDWNLWDGDITPKKYANRNKDFYNYFFDKQLELSKLSV